MLELAGESKAADVARFLATRANLRNRLLYAAQEGIPSLEGNVEVGIKLARDWVFRNLVVTCSLTSIQQTALRAAVRKRLFAAALSHQGTH